MPRNYYGVGRLPASRPSLVVHRPEQQAGPRMQMQISEYLGQASCVPHALPPMQLCPCPARKGEAAPGYARNAAGSGMQQEERAACYPESGQRACCQGEEGLLCSSSGSLHALPLGPRWHRTLLQSCLTPEASGQAQELVLPLTCWVTFAKLLMSSGSLFLYLCIRQI